ncbi:hypothetical protein Godav_025341, partial [Gossypium davidsonii]|nr:hypothetical protein [Gossypium davidsonii]
VVEALGHVGGIRECELSFVQRNIARRASLKKWREGLMKKVTELPIMCGVEGGLIVYCPDEQEPMVWPSHEEVQSLLKKFYQVPEMERNKKSMKLETYYKEKASKSRDQLKK